MARILVTEVLAERGLALMRDAGHEVDVQLDLTPEQLRGALPGAHAIVIRSATKVMADEIEAGRDLVVIGRAGVGVDNVDVEAATRRGVIVVNAPVSNIIATAELTLGLLLAQARNITQAGAALKQGRWERARWEGVELFGKTLGILGIGRVGTLVAQRAHAFGMRVIAWDKWMSAERFRILGIEPFELDEVVAQADFLTIHLLKTPESVGLVGRDLLAKAKPELRLVNTSRGGIVDEDALAEAVRSGQIAGAALDVFTVEPTTSSPLFELDDVVVTPHLAASTGEAQDKAGVTIAEQVVLALAGEFAPFAVNIAASAASETTRPFVELAEQLGRIFGSMTASLPGVLEVHFEGGLADQDTRILTLSVLKGLFSASGEPVSYVNAPQLAAERGVEVRETTSVTAQDYVNLITVKTGEHSVAGTLTQRGQPRLVMVDDHLVEVPPAEHMLVIRNDDRTGMIGVVGTLL
ncbi:MAG TPA: phosphoglycerate dehydrogenase, partial [Acidimicrobiales bacterium]|nr:phosphoglycerate dehydrogenase [Acidimicrobiales bacterium]